MALSVVLIPFATREDRDKLSVSPYYNLNKKNCQSPLAIIHFCGKIERKTKNKGETTMTPEERIAKGLLFCPVDPALKSCHLKTHNLCTEYNKTFEDETEKRKELIDEIRVRNANMNVVLTRKNFEK